VFITKPAKGDFHGAIPRIAALGLETSKLLEKPQIIGPKLANVIDGVLEHGDPLWPHAEGEAGELVGVVAAVLEHHRVHHARAHDFQPASPLAHAAALAAADDAVHVHFDRRLGEREVAGADAYLALLAEHPPGEGDDRPL